MKSLPTLFSRTSTQAVQQWIITIDGNSFYTTSGQINGAQTISKPTICLGKNIGKKNEKTPNEQAEAEALAKWEKQIKSNGYFEKIEDIDTVKFVEPMLAKKYFDRLDKIVYPVGVQLKFNGGRCIATKEGLFTRKGERYMSVPHIEESLKGFFGQWPEAVLDGELWAEEHGQKLNELMKIIRRTVHITKEDLEKSEKLVRYFIYDGYSFAGISPSNEYLKRVAAIQYYLRNIPYYSDVSTYIAQNHEDVMKVYNKFVEAGEEGAIVRILNAPYENKRSSNLLKVKPVEDAEFTIVDVEEGIGNRSGMAGKVHLRMDDGRTFAANLKGNEEQFREVLANRQNYIGKRATIYYFGWTGKDEGKPNYAQFDCNSSMGAAIDK